MRVCLELIISNITIGGVLIKKKCQFENNTNMHT